MNRLFLVISILCATWAFTYTFMLSAPDAQTALFWRKLSAIGWAPLYGVLLHFFLVLTKQESLLRQKWIYILLYLPALFFLIVFTSDSYTSSLLVAHTRLGWVFSAPSSTWLGSLFIAYYSVTILLAILLTWLWGAKSVMLRHKRQSRIITITLIAAFVLGALTDGFLPVFQVYDIPPMAIIFIMIPTLGIWYAIRRYRLMVVNPRTFSDDIFRNMSEGLLLVHQDGKIKLANASAVKLLGFREEELLNQSLLSFLSTNDFAFPLSERLPDDFAGVRNKVMLLKTRDSGNIPVLFSANLIRDEWGDAFGLVCTFQDISDRIRLDKTLQTERAHFEHLFHGAPIGIVLLDNDDKVIDCNAEFTRLFQYTKDDAAGRAINDLIVPDHLKDEASDVSQRAYVGEKVICETIRKRKDGSLIEVAITGKPISAKSGQIAIYGIYQDITSRKKTEQELQRRLLFQENAVNISTRFAATIDVDAAINESLVEIGKLSNADRSYVFLFNKEATYISNTNEWCAPDIEPQIDNLQNLPADLLPWLMEKLRNDETIIIENVAALPPGAEVEKKFLEELYIRSLLVLSLKVGGKLAGFIGFDFVVKFMHVSDIDLAGLRITAEVIGHALERKKFRDDLLQERDLLQALMDNIPDTIYFKDTQSRFTRINKAQAEMLGLSGMEDAIGKTDFDFFNESHAEVSFDAEQKLFEKGRPVIAKLEYFRTGDKWCWMSATKVPVRDSKGKIIGLVGVSHDVTEQKNIEQKLRARESFLSHLNEITNISLKALTTPDLFQLLADHMHKLLSSDISFITLWDPVNRSLIPVAVSGISQESMKSFKAEPGELTMTESVLKAEKVLVAEDVFNSPYLSPGVASQFPSKSLLGLPLIAYGQKYGAVLIGFSKPYKFTDEEIEFGTLAANQIALIVARTKMFEQLVENEKELRKINAEKDKLFSVVAHDLRSPFTSFLGLTELMTDEKSDLGFDDMREFAHAIQTSAKGLYQLLENLLEWSRMQGGYSDFHPEKLNLHEVVSDNLSMLQASSKKKNIETVNHIGKDTYIVADRKMLRSITGNLVSNAVKFTRNGGRVSISAEAKANGSVQVEVADTGIGMSSDMIKKLFRIDAKVASQGTEGEPSSGLGLILCKEFVEKHGGRIWVESKEGAGSKFYFNIPAKGVNQALNKEPKKGY